MKILHVNTLDYGGAATACRRIHMGLLNAGVDSKLLLKQKSKNIPESYIYHKEIRNSYFSRINNRVIRMLGESREKKNREDFLKRKGNAEIFSFPISDCNILENELYQEADIIQLNWVSGFLDEPSFFKGNNKPVIWRMADLYACGGGYHYELDFPFSELKPELDANFAIRLDALQNQNIHIVPISNWVKEKANESPLLQRFPKTVIHNGIDSSVFKIYNKNFAREVFGLDSNKKIILFGADSVSNKRKGFQILLDALEKISANANIQLVTFGTNTNIQNIEKSQLKIVEVGSIQDERLLAILYSAADYFIMPSIEEAFGQVTIEALACGTPVISFPNGGSSDILKDAKNGIVSKDFTAESLSESIEEALDTNFDRNIISTFTHKNFNILDKVQKYISLYQQILKNA